MILKSKIVLYSIICLIVCGLGIVNPIITTAQTEDNGTSSTIPPDYVTSYDASYPLWDISSSMNELVAIQTSTHLAAQGSHINARGDINAYILDEIDRVTREQGLPEDWRSNCCTVDVFNEDGVMIAHYPLKFIGERSDDGTFIVSIMMESGPYSEGQVYAVKPGFHLAKPVMGAVNPEVYFYLTTLPQAEFIVANPKVFNVAIANMTFDLPIASTSNIGNVSFSHIEKKLSLNIEPSNASLGVAQLKLPRDLLWGEIMILRDGQQIPLNEAIMLLQKDVYYSSILELNYSPEESHTIEILGTQAIPEFSSIFAILIGVLGTGFIILTRTITSHIR